MDVTLPHPATSETTEKLTIRGLASRFADQGSWSSLSKSFTFAAVKETGDELGLPGQDRVQDWAEIQNDVLLLGAQASRAV